MAGAGLFCIGGVFWDGRATGTAIGSESRQFLTRFEHDRSEHAADVFRDDAPARYRPLVAPEGTARSHDAAARSRSLSTKAAARIWRAYALRMMSSSASRSMANLPSARGPC